MQNPVVFVGGVGGGGANTDYFPLTAILYGNIAPLDISTLSASCIVSKTENTSSTHALCNLSMLSQMQTSLYI